MHNSWIIIDAIFFQNRQATHLENNQWTIFAKFILCYLLTYVYLCIYIVLGMELRYNFSIIQKYMFERNELKTVFSLLFLENICLLLNFLDVFVTQTKVVFSKKT